MRGIILVNKRQGWTSFDVVNYCKRIFNTREVGHLGTLDPMATGLLAVTVGSANKLFDMFLNKTKTYIAEFEFGYSTDTLDAEGEIENRSNNIPTIEEIEKVLPQFIGRIEQIPPKYSAKKINGKKAYEMARKGNDFELKPSVVAINFMNDTQPATLMMLARREMSPEERDAARAEKTRALLVV